MRETFQTRALDQKPGKKVGRLDAGLGLATCTGAKARLRRIVEAARRISMEGVHYCGPQCLESRWPGHLARLQSMSSNLLPRLLVQRAGLKSSRIK